MICLNEYYMAHDGTGQRVLVGYRVADLDHLGELGYRVSRSAEEDFLKARKKGVVYLSKDAYEAAEDSVFLYNNKGMQIAVAYRLKPDLSLI
jgi:hypothetical protein